MNAIVKQKSTVTLELMTGADGKLLAQEVILQRLEALYLQGVDDACARQKETHEKMERRINRLSDENARLVALCLDSEVLNSEEVAHIRALLTDLSDDSMLKWMTFNPSVHQAVMTKICNKSVMEGHSHEHS